MNTNSNVYTVVYTTVVCVLVAAILAFVAGSLKEKQDANVKAETICQILAAAQFDTESLNGNEQIISFYKENIQEAFVINGDGLSASTLSTDDAQIFNISDLKKANYDVVDPEKAENILIPVYAFKNGVTVLAIYGAGLWGPIWGYIALEPDFKTIKGAYFDHASETPGLGGKIKDDPSFRAKFAGKEVDFDDEMPLSIIKGIAPDAKKNAVDAISGATMTSNGLSKAIVSWVNAYKAYILSQKAVYSEPQGDVMPIAEEPVVEETVNE